VPASRLAVDLSGTILRVLEGTPGGRMRCGEGAPPPGSMDHGRVVDPTLLGQALRQLVARTEISGNRALIAASDAIASFRVLNFSTGTADEDIEAELKRQLPQQSDRMSLRRTDVLPGRGLRTIYAVIWDRSQVQAMAETARHAGLEPAVVELKSLCVARAIAAPSCILLDMTGEPCEAVLIDEHVPRVSHVFTIGSGGDLPTELAAGLRPVLTFYRQSTGAEFPAESPILVRADQMLPTLMATRLEGMTGHPVRPLPQPPRVLPEVRFVPFLTCIGLVMRRRQ